MPHQKIKQLLQEINLNFDIDTIHQVENFLLNDIGFVDQFETQYQVYGGAAIVSQVNTIPNISKIGHSKNGIKIQNVMSHLGELSKQKFLDTLNKQLQKWKKTPQTLKKRVQDIRYSYRFYKKYQNTFIALFENFVLANSSKQQFSALFWILYLYVKNSYIEPENIQESKILLIVLFRLIFQTCITKVTFSDIFNIMETNIGLIPEIDEEKRQYYYSVLKSRLNYFYCQRFSTENQINFDKLMKSFVYVERLMDDMSNSYSKEQTELRYFNQLDQMSYLELKKNLTPQVFRKPVQMDTVPLISSRLFFDQDDQQQIIQNQSTPRKQPTYDALRDKIPTPPPFFSFPGQVQSPSVANFESPITPAWKNPNSPPVQRMFMFDSIEATPITKKIQNEIWMKKKISSVQTAQLMYFKQKYEKMLNKPYSQFQMQIKQKNLEVIKQFTPKCQDYQLRHSQIYKMFISNCLEMEKQGYNVFSEGNDFLIKSIACLSTQIFNYVKTSVSFQYKFHVQKFGIQAIKGFKALQLFTQYIVNNYMPQDIKDYLKKVQKLFIISEIWQNSQGFKILCQSQSVQKKQNGQLKQFYSKIIQHGQKRVHEICKQAKIQKKITSKAINMLKFIFQNKPYLLKGNNIDQIILCCLMSCLSINQKHQQQTLQNLFNQYNSGIQFSFNSNQHGLKNNEGKEMGMIQFYNEEFLNEIQDMLNVKYDQLDDFLLTPVRIDIFNNPSFNSTKKFPSFGNITQKPGMFSFNPQRNSKTIKGSYLKNLTQNYQINESSMREQNNEDQNSITSPKFGRIFSFCPNQDKN